VYGVGICAKFGGSEFNPFVSGITIKEIYFLLFFFQQQQQQSL
jgi:hypothetical protein